MSDLDERFARAQDVVKELPERPDNDTLLKLYANFKQGTEGDVNGERPGFLDFVGQAKFDAWAKLEGTPRDEAKQNYISLVEKLTGDKV